MGGVAPLYVSVPLKQGIADVGDEDFKTVQVVHDIVEKYLGDNKVISAAAFTHYQESGFTREQIFSAVGENTTLPSGCWLSHNGSKCRAP